MPPCYRAGPMTSPSITTRPVTPDDAEAIGALHARVFGPGRFARTAYRVREGTAFASPFCRLATAGDRVIASLRLTAITVGGQRGALLLGPLAVDPEFANQGYGRRLVAESFAAATEAGYRIVLLVGDLAYYSRMSFVAVPPGQIRLPGPADPARILAHELSPGALAVFKGLIAPDMSEAPLPR